jgi:hypothetical protein
MTGTESSNEGAMYRVFVIGVTVVADGDDRSLWYGVSEVSELDAKGALERYLKDKGAEYRPEMEIRPATPREAASLNLSAGCVKMRN